MTPDQVADVVAFIRNLVQTYDCTRSHHNTLPVSGLPGSPRAWRVTAWPGRPCPGPPHRHTKVSAPGGFWAPRVILSGQSWTTVVGCAGISDPQTGTQFAPPPVRDRLLPWSTGRISRSGIFWRHLDTREHVGRPGARTVQSGGVRRLGIGTVVRQPMPGASAALPGHADPSAAMAVAAKPPTTMHDCRSPWPVIGSSSCTHSPTS
jgi:hypothetical protein